MHGEILKTEVWLLALALPEPFGLGFGTLTSLPRVLYRITAIGLNGHTVSGIGEASIDFPFSPYDAWDLYWVLSRVELRGRNAIDRTHILDDPTLRRDVLGRFPAAFAALNMALDDLAGRVEERSVLEFYGICRPRGRALGTIGFTANVAELMRKVSAVRERGLVCKVKGGQGTDKDVSILRALGEDFKTYGKPYAVDFNGAYDPNTFLEIIEELSGRDFPWESLLFAEQPTAQEYGIEALARVRQQLDQVADAPRVMADESFVTRADAVACRSQRILLNFKIQKIGGIAVAREIEDALGAADMRTMVGGTFPTAIGRAYDQQAASVLRYSSMPSDGWEPSTDWFDGDQHLIRERFIQAPDGTFAPFDGPGLAITPDWERLQPLVVPDPRAEYIRIRNGRSGDRIEIRLKPGRSYREYYQRVSGRTADWNL
jgi:L-alanine-DL-glutamate epimerase-like enolase superfamily enzyme